MRCKKIYYSSLLVMTSLLLTFSACDNSKPTPEPVKNKTVLAYIIGDINLWYMLEESINQMEAGWDDSFDGNLLVYLDRSPHLTQFGSPVLLRIRHDETDRIVSEVVKTYPDQDAVNPDVMRGVLNDVIEMFPAESHGLMIATHGSGAAPGTEDFDPHQNEVQSKAIVGPDRYGSTLEIYDLANILPIHYEFILFHACLMGNVETAYALQDNCDYLVASSESLPGIALPYHLVTRFLFTEPRADLYGLVRNSVAFYNSLPDGSVMPLTLSVVEMANLKALANSMRPLMARYAADLSTFYSNMERAYEFGEIYETTSGYYDMLQVVELQSQSAMPDEEEMAFIRAKNAAIPLVGGSKGWKSEKIDISELCGLSMYIPMPNNPSKDKLNGFYKKNYKWITDAGIDLLMK